MTDDRRVVPIEVETERAILSVLLIAPERAVDVGRVLPDEAWTRADHRALFREMCAGRFDIASLAATHAIVRDLLADTTASVSMLDRHVHTVEQAYLRRKAIERLAVVNDALFSSTGDVEALLHSAAVDLGSVRSMTGDVDGVMSLDDWEAAALNSPRPWVIPGVIPRQGRMIIVGWEGMGKSTILRQIAIATIAGIHPFRLDMRIRPQRVLVVDLENDPTFSIIGDPADDGEMHQRIDQAAVVHIAGMARTASRDWDPSRLRIWSRPEGIDLRTTADALRLERVVEDHRPDLVLFGPIYRAYVEGSKDEDAALSSGLQRTIDRLRTKYDAAWVLEHHVPKGDGRKRALGPIGSSVWLRWPDIGISLVPSKEMGRETSLRVDRFRGDRYRAPHIPTYLDRGRTWPIEGRWG